MEKGGELGIRKNCSLPIGKEEIKSNFIDWLERQCKKAGVTLEKNKEVSAELVKQLNPDVVILATGAKPLIPSIQE